MKSLEFAEYLNARLCHDLAGNIGAAVSGAEFLIEANSEIHDKAAHLLQESTIRLSEILEFYRLVFSPGVDGSEADMEAVRRICQNYVTNSRVSFKFPDEYLYMKDVEVSMSYAKMICCLSSIVSNSLVYGGDVSVQLEKNTEEGFIAVIKGSSKKVRLSEVMVDILRSKDISNTEMSSKVIFAQYAKMVAQTLGKAIIVDLQEDAIECRII